MVVLDRINAAAAGLIAALTGATALEAPAQGYPRRPSSGIDVVTFRVIRGPEIRGVRTYQQDEPTTLTVTIDAPIANTRIGLAVAGIRFFADLDGAPTPTTARDALQAAISAIPSLLPDVTVAANGADAIDLVTTVPGRLYCPTVFGPGIARTIAASTTCEISTGNARCMLQMTGYAQGASHAAQDLVGRITAGMALAPVHALRERLGVTFEGPAGDPVAIPGKVGETWESRAVVRIPVVLRSYAATPIDHIESTDVDLALRLDGVDVGPDTFTVTSP